MSEAGVKRWDPGESRHLPSNADNTAVALSFVESQAGNAVLIEDRNSGDSYDTTLVTGAAVAGRLGALHDAYKVLGSSGPIEFTAAYRTSGNGGNPVGKAIPVLRLGRGGGGRAT